MRTWFHALPPEPHVPMASAGCQNAKEVPQTKGRAGMPAAADPGRARKKAGFREHLAPAGRPRLYPRGRFAASSARSILI